MYRVRQSRLFVAIAFGLLFTSPAWSQTDDSDREKILAEHQRIIDAHLARDAEAMLDGAAEDYVLVNRGEVLYPTIEARRNRFAHYFGITVFTEYKDLIPPIVHVSDDGTAGWLIAQVEVSGIQESEEGDLPLHFVSAWIELYEKRNGEWVQIGNVSNFKD